MTNTINEQIKALEAKVAEWEKELSIIKSSSITSDSAAELIKKLELAIDDAEWEICDLEAQAGIDIFSKPAVDETTTAEQNTKGEKETMTTANTNTTTNTIKGEETMTTTTNTTITNNTKGANKTMTTTTKTTTNKTTKGATIMNKYLNAENVVVMDADFIAEMNEKSVEMQAEYIEFGVSNPTLATFIGQDNEYLIADGNEDKFVVVKKDGRVGSLSFGHAVAKELINFLMVVFPRSYADFTEMEEYKAMERMNLKSGLTVKAKKHGKMTRSSVFMASMNLEDVHVYKNGKFLAKLTEMKKKQASQILDIEKDSSGRILRSKVKESVTFWIFKNAAIEDINDADSLFITMSEALATTRFANARNKQIETFVVNKAFSQNGETIELTEKKEGLLLDEMMVMDGSATLPFGNEVLNSAVLAGVFGEVNVFNTKVEKVEAPAVLYKKRAVKTYNSYIKSMSQARSNGAMGFDHVESAVDFLEATGSDAISYGEAIKNEGGELTGEFKMAVDKAYKRFALGMSNGMAPRTGLLSRFAKGENIKVEKFAKGKKHEDAVIIVITNKDGETITLAITDDFTSVIRKDQRFLLNVIDTDYALEAIEEFAHWENEGATAILERNLTDGGGYIHGRLVEELRAAGVINSFDAFQLRVSNAVKGAVIQFDEICELYGADIVLTDGMVKSKDIQNDIQKNGFQLYVVGQRKDGVDGMWISSQALQQLMLTSEELMAGANKSVELVKAAIAENKVAEMLAIVNASLEEEEGEFNALDFARLAMENEVIADEQYLQDEMTSLLVKKLNQLLDSKLYTSQARTRYMFSDPIAIYNAAKAGRHEVLPEDAVLNPYEVICPSIVDGEYVMQTGKAISVRYPVTVTHEIPVVIAVAHPLYAKYVEQGLWQGCTFFDCFSWVVAQQAGADHDGDTSTICFEEMFVNARLRMEDGVYGKRPVLPFIDAYVMVEDGEAIEFATGCPEYVAPGKEKAVVVERELHGFKVVGNTIYFTMEQYEANRRNFFLAEAELAREITLATIEGSLIGQIANRAMNLTDLITRENLLTVVEREELEYDMLKLTTAGRWEIDRPKHGGAYLEMPVIKELFEKFEDVIVDDEAAARLETKAEFNAYLEEKRGLFRHLFVEVKDENNNIIAWKVVKPNWMANRKDEKGIERKGSIFEQGLAYSCENIKTVCDFFVANHGNKGENNIRPLVIENSELAARLDEVKEAVAPLYTAFSAKEKARTKEEIGFMEAVLADLREARKLGNKDISLLSRAKRKAIVRAEFPQEMTNFKNGRELHEAQLRKAVYEVARNLKVDVRAVVGAMYLVVNEQKTEGKTSWRKDGRGINFAASNGNLAMVFEVFKDEMTSLLTGKVSQSFFTPMDLTFMSVESKLVEEVAPAASSSISAKMIVANEQLAGKTSSSRSVQVAVRLQEIKGQVVKVMYVLKKGAQVEDAATLEKSQVVCYAVAPENFLPGVYEVAVSGIAFGEVVNGKQEVTIKF